MQEASRIGLISRTKSTRLVAAGGSFVRSMGVALKAGLVLTRARNIRRKTPTVRQRRHLGSQSYRWSNSPIPVPSLDFSDQSSVISGHVAVGDLRFAICIWQSAIGNRQSAIGNRQSAIGNR